MRERYELVDIGYVDIEASFHAHIFNVMSAVVEPEYQGLGIGTALMKAACRDADREGIQLWLVMTPFPGREAELENFYVRLGFVKDKGYMIRRPR